jgi:hypothetical protein
LEVTARTICLILALACFAIAAFWTPPASRPFNLVAAGLALMTLAFLLG